MQVKNIISVLCASLIIFGMAYIVYSQSGTTIGLNIATNDLLVSGNATTTGNQVISGNLNVHGAFSPDNFTFNPAGIFTVTGTSTLATTSISGPFTLSGIANFLSNLIVVGNATTTGNQVISGTLNVSGTSTLATTTLSGELDLNLKQLKNVVLEKLSSFPSSPVEGQMFWSTATSTPYWYDATNSRWRTQKHEATIVVAASDSKDKEKADYVCDGTNDEVEILAAMNALPTSGGAVILLEGNYSISATMNIPKDNVTIRGQGRGTKLATTANINIFQCAAANQKNDIIIENLFLYGDGDAAKTGQRGISFAGDRWIIRNNWVENMGYDCIIVEGDRNIVSGNVVKDCKDDGINPLNGSYNTIVGNVCTGMTHDGIHLGDGATYNTVVGNTSTGNGGYGVLIWNNSAGNLVSGNICDGNTDGIRFTASALNTDNLVIGNSCKNNTGSGITVSAAENQIVGNQCNNNLWGINLTNGDRNQISNNTCSDNGRGIFVNSSDGNIISGNVIAGATGIDGINILDSSNNRIIGNDFSEAGTGNSIYIRGTGTGNIVSDNYI